MVLSVIAQYMIVISAQIFNQGFLVIDIPTTIILLFVNYKIYKAVDKFFKPGDENVSDN